MISVGATRQQAISGSRLTITEEAGHSPPKDQPEEFLRAPMDCFSTTPIAEGLSGTGATAQRRICAGGWLARRR